MNKYIKGWIAALRSGKYKQGKGQLCKVLPDGSKKYCCLGVLCETQFPDLHKQVLPYSDGDGANLIVYNDCIGFLPVDIKEFVGDKVFEKEIDLVDLNDGLYDFDQIADYIEKELLTSE